MPLDHYISQVHLKNFYSPTSKLLHAIRKSDLLEFPCRARDVCRIENNSTNAYLMQDRSIEEFLKSIEPNYNFALDALRARQARDEIVYIISGFIAFVATCTPAGMRIQSEPIKQSVIATTAILEAQGQLSSAPAALGREKLTKLIDYGIVDVHIDRKYPQALGIAGIRRFIAQLGNATWQILINESADSPFFTSDFPVAIEATNNPAIDHRIIPLAPNIAVRIIPNVRSRNISISQGFPLFHVEFKSPDHREIRAINTAIVRSAENLVFFRDQKNWIYDFVKKNARYQIAAVTQRHGLDRGQLLIAKQKIVAKTD